MFQACHDDDDVWFALGDAAGPAEAAVCPIHNVCLTISLYIYIYIYIHREREIDRERERARPCGGQQARRPLPIIALHHNGFV